MAARTVRRAAPGEVGRVELGRVSVRLPVGEVAAEVVLRDAGATAAGHASHPQRRHAIALATLDALQARRPAPLSLVAIERHGDVVLVRLDAERSGRAVILVGSAWVGEHEDRAVARAVLDATNRHLGASATLAGVSGDAPDDLTITAHQIRGPLAVVSEVLETVLEHRDRLEPDATRDLLERALGQAGTLLERLDSLLEASSGRGAAVAVAARSAIDDAIQDLDDQLSVTVQGAADTLVMAQPGHLREMVGILLGNAVRHGAPPITVTIAPGPERVEILVEDEGEGVPERVHATLFTTQAGSTAAGGHGIGLAAASVLAEANGGSVAYRPRAGHGARFVLTLPVATPSVRGARE